jgi:septal ring-binding cell division protein DamX
MEEHAVADDQSHYEISLTAGQAFVAFVLLMLSLASAFAFGLMLGKGQADERLVVRKETPVVTEASALGGKAKTGNGEIVELPVAADDFVEDAPAASETMSTATEATATATVIDEPNAEPAAVAAVTPAPAAVTPVAEAPVAAAPKVPHIAQLLSTGDQKTAEALAVKVINGGFNTAYVERGATDKGAVFRVRVRFDSESDARAAETKLREFSKDVWITAK